MGVYDGVMESFAKSRVGGWLVLNVLTYVDRWLIRVSGGKLSSGVGSRLHHAGLVLRTIGAKSGKPRDVALIHFEDGDDLIVIASATGQKKNPAWYYNLKKNPDAEVMVKGRTIPVTARQAEGDERDRLWSAATKFYSGFDTYKDRTARKIPVMVLARRGA